MSPSMPGGSRGWGGNGGRGCLGPTSAVFAFVFDIGTSASCARTARERAQSACPYEHIEESARKRGYGSRRAKQIAGATVNEKRRKEGRTSKSKGGGRGKGR
jgi:hypothetical protein